MRHRNSVPTSYRRIINGYWGLDDSNDKSDVLKVETETNSAVADPVLLPTCENIVTSVTIVRAEVSHRNAQAGTDSNEYGQAISWHDDRTDADDQRTSVPGSLSAKDARRLARHTRAIEAWLAQLAPQDRQPYYLAEAIARGVGQHMSVLGPVLAHLGWHRAQARIGGVQRAIWVPPDSPHTLRPVGRPRNPDPSKESA